MGGPTHERNPGRQPRRRLAQEQRIRPRTRLSRKYRYPPARNLHRLQPLAGINAILYYLNNIFAKPRDPARSPPSAGHRHRRQPPLGTMLGMALIDKTRAQDAPLHRRGGHRLLPCGSGLGLRHWIARPCPAGAARCLHRVLLRLAGHRDPGRYISGRCS